MEIIKNFFQSIWNFFLQKKKTKVRSFDIRTGLPVKENVLFPLTPKTDAALKAKPRTESFNKQQLPGKTYNIGKSRFRIKKKLGFTESEKQRYEIIQL